MKHFKPLVLSAFITSLVFLLSCDKNNDPVLFSLENDKQLGAEVAAEIAATDSLVILSRDQYPEAYSYLEGMKNEILNSGKVTYKDDFVWELHIIDADVLNAFATPGGYIYIYTGLIKYLDNADHLAGVLGHEIAHADQRHSIKQLQQSYSLSLLIGIALGNNPSQLKQLAAELAGTLGALKFSRDDESEADSYAVDYLAQTPYACNGVAGFFEKLIGRDQAGFTPEFLSTHPNPANRVQDIQEMADDLGCDTTPVSESNFTYQDLKNSLP